MYHDKHTNHSIFFIWDYLELWVMSELATKEQVRLARNHVNRYKREAIAELLALHKQDRAKVNSQCDTLINMSTIDKYLDGLND